MSSRKKWLLLTGILFLAGAAGGYVAFRNHLLPGMQVQTGTQVPRPGDQAETMLVRVYYPASDRLVMVEKKIPKRTKETTIAEAVLEEFFRGDRAVATMSVPQLVKVLGLYRDQQKIFYADLSDELRRNFQGDALAEYLLLKGIYDSLVSNVPDFQDLKILIEGREVETLGGHFYLKYPLGSILVSEYKGGETPPE